jgi:hypothetical protein
MTVSWNRALVWPFLGPNIGPIPLSKSYLFVPYFRKKFPSEIKKIERDSRKCP